MNKLVIILSALISLAGCSDDPNSKPEYGDESGLPKNCRAYIQESVDAWRNGVHSTEDTMDAIERNCGLYGDLWGDSRAKELRWLYHYGDWIHL